MDACTVSITTSMAAGSSSFALVGDRLGSRAGRGSPLPPFSFSATACSILSITLFIILRGAVRLDKADHAVDLLGGDEAALHAAGLALAERGVEHIAAADKLFRAGGIENDADSSEDATAKAMRLGMLAFIRPVMTSADGRCVAMTKCIPAARPICATRRWTPRPPSPRRA